MQPFAAEEMFSSGNTWSPAAWGCRGIICGCLLAYVYTLQVRAPFLKYSS